MEKAKTRAENDKDFMAYWAKAMPETKYNPDNEMHLNIAHAYLTGFIDGAMSML